MTLTVKTRDVLWKSLDVWSWLEHPSKNGRTSVPMQWGVSSAYPILGPDMVKSSRNAATTKVLR